ncbi:hypothetical protein H6F77_08950 [Microcoleus sp. FACHB-831]|uniref:hypothetical protein n=1 Tax=Microcoleus sp. FACHB-831 TaxID=2692827 RepID=UPI001683D541|nr:hypothetical protein [Microcoleus sp. FACHB-831]MBD1921219.1 hypothetical protein [Microcoleus sp. FACHB-831]
MMSRQPLRLLNLTRVNSRWFHDTLTLCWEDSDCLFRWTASPEDGMASLKAFRRLATNGR